MEKLAGYVEHIIYRNTDNGYTVLNLVSGEDEITCVGIFSTIAEGENIEATGDYTDHPTYGTQFKVVSFEEKAPEDQEAIERYLGSGAIKGIGLAMAARIVRRFREDTFRIIEEEPERLAEVKGISERKAMEIASQVNEKRDLRQAMIFLQQFGITMNLAVKIYNTAFVGTNPQVGYAAAIGIVLFVIIMILTAIISREWVSGQRTILQQRQESGRILISVCGVGYCIHCFRRLVRGIPFCHRRN